MTSKPTKIEGFGCGKPRQGGVRGEFDAKLDDAVRGGQTTATRQQRHSTPVPFSGDDMALSTNINLPRSHHARFPDRCVVCNADSPNSHVRIISGSIGWWTIILTWWGMPYVVKAPACNGCAWKLHAVRFASLAVTMTIGILAFVYVWPNWRDSFPPAIQKWAFLGIAIVCLLPQIVYEIALAKPFDMTVYAKSVDYEFTSKEYALDFAILNHDAKLLKIDGAKIGEEKDNRVI